jgi:hypothetical protein
MVRSRHAERQREAWEALGRTEAEDLELDDNDPDDCDLDSARAYHTAHEQARRQLKASFEVDVDQLPGFPSPARSLQESMYHKGPITKLDLPVSDGHSGSFFNMEGGMFSHNLPKCNDL